MDSIVNSDLNPLVDHFNPQGYDPNGANGSVTPIEPEPAANNYEELFPKLPSNFVPQAMRQETNNIGKWNQKMKVGSSEISQVFRVPMEERKYKNINDNFGGQGEQAKVCSEIMQKTGATIEICLGKDQSLTVLVTGKPENVSKARRMVVQSLQTQANVSIPIPKDHHRIILGAKGARLKELQEQTATKITVPKLDDPSEDIHIVGAKEGIDKAVHEIQLISEEQAKRASQRLNIEKVYHPFILGPNGSIVQNLIEQTGAKIHVPPATVQSDEIFISGEKEGVLRAVEIVNGIYEEKKKCHVVSVQVKKDQHKYVIGPKGSGIQEILGLTGVSVEVPSADKDQDTITLRGDPVNLGDALREVYKRANSVVIKTVPAETRLHKLIIGFKGSNIREIVQESPKVHIEFSDQGYIKIEGPPEEVKTAEDNLVRIRDDLKNRIVFEELTVDSRFHKHIIGKSGSNVNRLKAESGVQITIGGDGEWANKIKIEGENPGVANVKREIMEMVKKLESEKTKELKIENRFHSNIIGARGEKIREIREQFPEVNISFPDPGENSNTVTLRGPEPHLTQCLRKLDQISKKLLDESYCIEVKVSKDIHKNIIGKGGAKIKKIREETGTKIDLPMENSNCDYIKITGIKANVEKAEAIIRKIQEDLAPPKDQVTLEVKVPSKYHNQLIGPKGQHVRHMQEDFSCSIKFPTDNTSDIVTIRGSKVDAEKAKKHLTEISKDMEKNNHSVNLKCKPAHHRFLIGRGGAKIKKLRDKFGVRIHFPSAQDTPNDVITLTGKKECVEEAKAELEEVIKSLDNVIESEVDVPTKYHQHFITRRAAVLSQIQDEFGGVSVSFPKQESKSTRVTIKGSAECVEGAKARILEIIEDLESQVTIEVEIAQVHHRTLMGQQGRKIQKLTQDHNVNIKFPERQERTDATANGDDSSLDGSTQNGDHDSPRKSIHDIIRITGKKENCESARIALLEAVPISVEVEVPYDYHRFIIGQKGKEVRELMDRYDVNIKIPDAQRHSDTITIHGAPPAVEQAKQALADRVEQLDREAEDRKLKSFSLNVEVNPKYHSKIIGKKGIIIQGLREKYDVLVNLPDKADVPENLITIVGYQKNAEAARDAILEIVREQESLITRDLEVDHRIHSRLIGARGRNIKKIMEKYRVEVKFPGNSDPQKDCIYVTGSEEAVEDASEHIMDIAEEYMQDMEDDMENQRYLRDSSRDGETQKPWTSNTGFIVNNAPWEQQAPDTSSAAEFPSFGKPSGAPESHTPTGAWGHR